MNPLEQVEPVTLQERVHGAARPPTWLLDKLHRVLRVRRGIKNDGMKEDNLLSLSYGRIIPKDINTSEGLLPENFEGYQIVEPGNIVMRLTDLQNDKRSLRQGLVKERGIITSAYDALDVPKGQCPEFWFYSLLALDLAKHYYSLGGGVRQSVKFSDFPNDWIYLPDLTTQRQIADFLDRETARIDLLIEKKQRMVELLEQRRLSEISAVFDTVSIAFRRKLKFFIHGIEQGWSPQCEERTVDGDDWGVLKLGAVTTGVYDEAEHKALPSNLKPIPSLRVNVGDVLVARASGSPKLVGRAAYVNSVGRNLMISDKHYRIKPDPTKTTGEYLSLVINSEPSRRKIEMNLSSAEGMARNIGQGVIRELECPFPSLEEQSVVLGSIRKTNQRASVGIRLITSSITSLREYRSALITAAVTGQIDPATNDRAGSTNRQLDAMEAGSS